MSCYHHLSIEERESLAILLAQGYCLRTIAKMLGRATSTISRELKRVDGDYLPSKAQSLYKQRRTHSVRTRKLDDPILRQRVQFLLSHLFWSPEQIENRLRLEGQRTVCFSTIYRALDNGCLRDTLRYYLRHKYKALGKARKPSRKCFAQSIEQRPQEASERAEPGHWEGDVVYLPGEKRNLVTLVDRYSRFLLTEVTETLESAEVCDAVCKLLAQAPLVRSVTFDCGAEFANMHSTVFGSKVFFAHPGAPWERPTNENTNGLIRQFLPKGKTKSPFNSSNSAFITALLNFRPRACLNWLSPYEVAFSQVLHFT